MINLNYCHADFKPQNLVIETNKNIRNIQLTFNLEKKIIVHNNAVVKLIDFALTKNLNKPSHLINCAKRDLNRFFSILKQELSQYKSINQDIKNIIESINQDIFNIIESINQDIFNIIESINQDIFNIIESINQDIFNIIESINQDIFNIIESINQDIFNIIESINGADALNEALIGMINELL